MLYCEICMTLTDQDKCPGCKKKKLRPPKDNDPVYLLTQNAIWAGAVEDILREGDIPCLKQSEQRSAFTIIMGEITATYRIFVPYSAYQAAKERLADFLKEDDHHAENGQNCD